jgi:hypothetical protein
MQTNPTPLSGTRVSISDTAPTADRYNLSICEILPSTSTGTQTWTASGTISPAGYGSGTIVMLSGAANAAVTADSSGNYTFTGLANGTYSATPSKSGYVFTPSTLPITVNGANVTGVQLYGSTVVQRACD